MPTPVLVPALHCRRPAKGRDVVFADAAGILIIGEVLGLSAQGWRIGQFHGETRYKIRRPSGGRWRTAWRVVAVYPTAASGAFYEAVALGLYERTRQIQLAIGGKGPNADAGAGRPEQDPPAHREGKTLANDAARPATPAAGLSGPFPIDTQRALVSCAGVTGPDVLPSDNHGGASGQLQLRKIMDFREAYCLRRIF